MLTGLITGTIAWQIFEFLKVKEFSYVRWYQADWGLFFPDPVLTLHWWYLVLIIPIIWILGVLLGYFLGQWLDFFNQFGKFATIGFTNFAITVGVLDVLIFRTNYTSGIGYSIISGVSFIFGVFSSYIWNKYWAFRVEGSDQRQSNVGLQFGKFFLVTIIAFAVNVTIASLVVNYINPLTGMDAKQWANIGTVIGSAAGLVFSFVGFRIAVFKD